MITTKQKGDKGEAIAAEFLEKKGYIIVERNYNTRKGEIDIIALQRDTLVIVEVKSRKNDDFISGREAVTLSKQNKIKDTTRILINDKKIRFKSIRFDVIEYYWQNDKIEHFVDAF